MTGEPGGVPASRVRKHVAIVGAGISGLSCARRLREQGVTVSVIEKSRGTGGRAATHRSRTFAFDSGAQYFTARNPAFVRQVEQWLADGVVAPFAGKVVRLCNGIEEPGSGLTARFVGNPGMSAISRSLAGAVDATSLITSFRAVDIESRGGGLFVAEHGGDRKGGFDAVLVAAPAPQAAAIVGQVSPGLAEAADRVPFSSCLALLAAFEPGLSTRFGGAFVQQSSLSWIASRRDVPGGASGQSWVLHGASDWSDANFAADDDSVVWSMCNAFQCAIGLDVPDPVYSRVHRWRYALPTEPLQDDCLFDPEVGVGVCGDWCSAPNIEGAFVSGVALAERVLRWLK